MAFEQYTEDYFGKMDLARQQALYDYFKANPSRKDSFMKGLEDRYQTVKTESAPQLQSPMPTQPQLKTPMQAPAKVAPKPAVTQRKTGVQSIIENDKTPAFNPSMGGANEAMGQGAFKNTLVSATQPGSSMDMEGIAGLLEVLGIEKPTKFDTGIGIADTLASGIGAILSRGLGGQGGDMTADDIMTGLDQRDSARKGKKSRYKSSFLDLLTKQMDGKGSTNLIKEYDFYKDLPGNEKRSFEHLAGAKLDPLKMFFKR